MWRRLLPCDAAGPDRSGLSAFAGGERQAAAGRQDTTLFCYRAGIGDAVSGGEVHLSGSRRARRGDILDRCGMAALLRARVRMAARDDVPAPRPCCVSASAFWRSVMKTWCGSRTETTRHICAFLQEDFEPAMLDWQDRAEQVASRDRHLHARLREPMSNDAVAVWRRRVSGIECFAMEACLHRELAAGDYTLRYNARAWRLAFLATKGLLRGAAPALRRAIPYLQRRSLLPRNLYL